MQRSSLRSLQRNVALLTAKVRAPATFVTALALLGAPLASTSAAVPPSAEGRSYAAATDHAEATRAALQIMSLGGNAVDGAIAAALALGVVSPSASGIGGGGFALVYTARDRKVSAFDFRERAPLVYDETFLYRPREAKGSSPAPRGVVVGVPGEPAGLEMLSRRFARKSLAEDAAPAVTLATKGFYLGRFLAGLLPQYEARLKPLPAMARSFFPGDVPAPFASRIRRPELGVTIAQFGARGKRSIYEGPTARKIVDAVRAAGGTMSETDLLSYAVKERAPLTAAVDRRVLYTMPAPSAGGLMLLETVLIHGASPSSPLAPLGFGSSAYVHLVAEAMRGAYADRVRLAGDPDYVKGVDAAYQDALSPRQIAARRARIDPLKSHAPPEFKTREQGTSHLVVADADGNVVALTTTVNDAFGAGIAAGDTGILLNNELDDFTNPEDVRPYGLGDGGPNRPRAGARPVSSMTPTIVLEGDLPILAVGGSGGPRIATGVTQATLARLVFQMDPNACVSSPRVHVLGPDLLVDPEVAADVRTGLAARGENVRDEVFRSSAVQMIAWDRAGPGPPRLLAASDPRKAGLAAAR
jgi:gamma-glutamyltranspeptidase / glutathione hydrolase